MNNDLAVHDYSVSRGGATQPLALDELAQERGHRLPNEHPRPPKDGICVSARARDQIVAQKAPEINPLTFWDHQTRTAPIGSRRLNIDPSSSYRLE